MESTSKNENEELTMIRIFGVLNVRHNIVNNIIKAHGVKHVKIHELGQIKNSID